MSSEKYDTNMVFLSHFPIYLKGKQRFQKEDQ